MSKLIYNAMRTPDGTVLVSRHRHDYVTYTDKNGKEYMVDGGLDYIRRSAHGDEADLCLYDDQPHEVQREVRAWGTRGKDGKQPLKWLVVKDMETTHIEAVLALGYVGESGIRQCLVEELKQRGVSHE